MSSLQMKPKKTQAVERAEQRRLIARPLQFLRIHDQLPRSDAGMPKDLIGPILLPLVLCPALKSGFRALSIQASIYATFYDDAEGGMGLYDA